MSAADMDAAITLVANARAGLVVTAQHPKDATSLDLAIGRYLGAMGVFLGALAVQRAEEATCALAELHDSSTPQEART